MEVGVHAEQKDRESEKGIHISIMLMRQTTDRAKQGVGDGFRIEEHLFSTCALQ